MKRQTLSIALIIAMFLSSGAYAGQAPNALGTCLADALTGKERKDIAKWMFFAIASHPRLGDYVTITKNDQDESDHFFGQLLTRLLTINCPMQATAALNEEGSVTFQRAFEMVGQAAIQELMMNDNVNTTLHGFEKYVDRDKLAMLGKK